MELASKKTVPTRSPGGEEQPAQQDLVSDIPKELQRWVKAVKMCKLTKGQLEARFKNPMGGDRSLIPRIAEIMKLALPKPVSDGEEHKHEEKHDSENAALRKKIAALESQLQQSEANKLARFKELDINGDGTLTREEYMAAPAPPRRTVEPPRHRDEEHK